ncbi:hypothetical protein B0H67DRAFT_606864 [Lasiosphaeris hirsuta]|uniref:Uncharacterized protein n=1 Tax=Lasiosphaeris hirsuta TaxID=260670 RepID=A0AA40AY68_9PEZI|nr:hypothetical protein B0H67DRAFT_606864 [Lasiosphaeris hirsuta]
MVDIVIGSATKGGNAITKAKSPDAVIQDEQVSRFVLLTFLMKGAGLCAPDIRLFLGKYLRSITKTMYGQLRADLPNIQDVKLDTWVPTLEGLAALGDKNINAEHMKQALELAHLRLIEEPSWFDGQDGWFLNMAEKLCSFPVFKEDGTFAHSANRFWLPETENALYIAAMARLQAVHSEDNEFLTSQAPVYREAWWALFGVFFSDKHFKEDCKCKDTETLALKTLHKYKGKFHPGNENHEVKIAELEAHLTTIMKDVLGFDANLPTVRNLCSRQLDSPRPVSEDVYTLHWGNQEFLDMLYAMPKRAWTMAKELKGEAGAPCPAPTAIETEADATMSKSASKNRKRRARKNA